MRHEASYVLTEDYDTVRSVIHRMIDLGYEYSYRELKMADGTTHKFCVYGDEWTELRDMDATLAWICLDLYRLKDAYYDGIVRKEATNAE